MNGSGQAKIALLSVGLALAALVVAQPASGAGILDGDAYERTCHAADDVFVDVQTGEIRLHAEAGSSTGDDTGCATVSIFTGSFHVEPGTYEMTAHFTLMDGEWAPRASVTPLGPGQLASADEAVALLGVKLTPLAWSCSTEGDCGGGGRIYEDLLACQPFPWCESFETLTSPPPVAREYTITGRVTTGDDTPMVRLKAHVHVYAHAIRTGPPYEVVAHGGLVLKDITIRRL